MAFPALSPAIESRQPTKISHSQIQLEIRTLPVSVQFTDHDICRVTDDRTSNTGNIPTQETHPSLLQRIVALLGPPERSVDIINRRLKRRKLDHRIRNLPPP